MSDPRADPARGRPRVPARARRGTTRGPIGVILRGPLGVGKTTVARALGRELRATVLSIDRLLTREPWDGGTERLFRRANRRAVPRALRALAIGRPVIVEGNFYWGRVLDELRDELPVRTWVIELRAPLATCIARDRARARSYGPDGARAVFAKVARVRRGYPVDASGTLDGTVRAVRRCLARRAGRAPPPGPGARRRGGPPRRTRRGRRDPTGRRSPGPDRARGRRRGRGR